MLIREILCQPERIMGVDINADANAMEVLAQQVATMPIVGRLFGHHSLVYH
jgi:hypothetical protein